MPGTFEKHQRPALLDVLRGRMLAGQDTWAAIREPPGADERSAVRRRGAAPRLAGLAKPDALLSWAARTPEGAGEIAQATAQALDARAAALGDRLLAEPEPWVVRHLGPPPHEAKPGLQAMLQADYARRAGIAQSYREAAGVADPHQVIRWEGHKGNPSWKRSGTTRSAPCRSATSKPT